MADNLGNFNSSTNGVAAVTADATGNGPGSNGVHGITTSAADSAVYGEHLGTGIGVFGRGGNLAGEGVFGESTSNHSGVYGKNNSNGNGVSGESASGIGVYGSTSGPNNGPPYSFGVVGHGLGAGAGYYTGGVLGISDGAAEGVRGEGMNYGVHGVSDFIGVAGRNEGQNQDGAAVYALSTGAAAALVGHSIGTGLAGDFFGPVFIRGAFTQIGGPKSAAVPHPNGSYKRLYCMESPESWFEDFGVSELAHGSAIVKIDSDFSELVIDNGNYHVFVTAEGDCEGLYVTNKKKHSFEIRESKGGKSSIKLSYRIVAKRKDIVAPRFETVKIPKQRTISEENKSIISRPEASKLLFKKKTKK